MNHRPLFTTGLLLLAACAGDVPEPAPGPPATDVATAVPAPAPVGVVDSIFPMPVMIERFQAEAPRRATAFPDDAARSRDELVQRFVAAVEDSSSAALRALTLDMSEYAWLYAPESRMTQDPYRQPPAVGWLLVEQNGLKGELRALRRFGGRDLGFRSYHCPDEPIVEGENRVWAGCMLEIDAHPTPIRLFGSIIERGGRWKFISLANDL